MSYNIAIVGATGLVGREFLNLLENSNISVNKLKLFASANSVGKKIKFNNKDYLIESLTLKQFEDIDFAIFAAGSKISTEFIPQLKNYKVYCIDKSSAYRMDKNVPLIIPEINNHLLKDKPKLISTPNCTTTIMLMALNDLDQAFKMKKIIASTYQAASGGGKKLIDKLLEDTKNTLNNSMHLNTYGFNLYLHDSALDLNKYNLEEMKLIQESHKILNNDKIKINATCVRVPVIRAHSISINVEFEKPFSLDEVYKVLRNAKNIQIFEDYENNKFATPKDASYKKEILVSRIRKDLSNPQALDLWVCGDQLLKGAAWNGFQILENLIEILEKR